MRLYLITGAGRCADAFAYVLGDSPEDAVQRLTRPWLAEFFVVGSVEPVHVLPDREAKT